ncbi:MAG: hypothetical protein RJA36_342 [Pseudomonadota bacterium]|jgi:predicted transglutaminase-like cysteine proteinase
MRSSDLPLRLAPRGLPRRAPAWLRAGALLAVMGWTLAQSGLERAQALALQRYGQAGAETVAGWRRLLEESRQLGEGDKLGAVNGFFNRRIRYASDLQTWGQAEYWATPLELMGRAQGDCEDYAIAKYLSLLLLGVPAEKLRLIYVRARLGQSGGSEAHMVLGYYAEPAGEPLILDSLAAAIRPASARPDLAPVFSFNTQGLWVPGTAVVATDPSARLSRWRDVLERIQADGMQP